MANQSFSLRSILEKEKLTSDGSNYIDWHCNLRIILRQEKKEYVLSTLVPLPPGNKASKEEQEAYNKHFDDESDVNYLIIVVMSPEHQKYFMDSALDSCEIMEQLKELFQNKAHVERCEITKALVECKMVECSSVSSHVMKMMSYMQQLEKLDNPVPQRMATDFIINSLTPSYLGFVMNFHMNDMEKSLDELHGMLKMAEEDIKKSDPKVVLSVSDKWKKIKKKNTYKTKKGKGKAPVKNISGPKGNQKLKSPATPDTECFYYKGNGHWKRNCPKYLTDKKARNVPSTSGNFVIVVNITTSNYEWVFDTGSCAHICQNEQALKNRRQLKKGEVMLRVEKGVNVSVVAIGNVELALP
jgi:gag-polypeptide of LTR copia-type